MRLKEKINAETKTEPFVFLHREGLFWKVYEWSAMRFDKEIRSYKLQKRFIRTVDQDVVSLGFPDSKLKDLLVDKTFEEITPAYIKVTVSQTYDEETFNQWKAEVPLIKDDISSSSSIGQTSSPTLPATVAIDLPDAERNVLESLRSFRVETSTPLECLLFISELKKKLYNNDV